jgi:hypothetical protein
MRCKNCRLVAQRFMNNLRSCERNISSENIRLIGLASTLFMASGADSGRSSEQSIGSSRFCRRKGRTFPERDEVVDATIAIQSFIFNTFGCLDNLAWIWVYEKGVKNDDGSDLNFKRIGLGKSYKEVRRSFSKQFLSYLESRQAWFDHIVNFRDSLAHRIPLYIPPYVVLKANHDEFNRLELAMNDALSRGDTGEYDRIEPEQRKLGVFRP